MKLLAVSISLSCVHVKDVTVVKGSDAADSKGFLWTRLKGHNASINYGVTWQRTPLLLRYRMMTLWAVSLLLAPSISLTSGMRLGTGKIPSVVPSCFIIFSTV